MRTFNFVVLAILGLFFASCDSDDDHLGDWAKSVQFSGTPREAAVCFTDKTTGSVFVGLGYGSRSEEFSDVYEFKNGSWSQRLDTKFPASTNPGPGTDNGNGRHSAVAFVIGDYAYVGTGYVSAVTNTSNGANVERNRTFFKDFYRFNMKTKEWDPNFKSEIPGEGRRDAVAFSDGKYGYMGTGYGENDRVFKDFYRYDPDANVWTEIPFDGDARYGATAFVVGGAAYVCLGAANTGVTMTSVIDVMKFDFTSQAWTKMGSLTDKPDIKQDKDYDRIPRAYAVSFTSNKGNDGEEYAYIATGSSSNRTVWKYNHKKDQWHQMEDLSDYASSTVMAVGFSVDGYGYYTTGAGGTDASTSTPSCYIETWKFIPDVKEDKKNDY